MGWTLLCCVLLEMKLFASFWYHIFGLSHSAHSLITIEHLQLHISSLISSSVHSIYSCFASYSLPFTCATVFPSSSPPFIDSSQSSSLHLHSTVFYPHSSRFFTISSLFPYHHPLPFPSHHLPVLRPFSIQQSTFISSLLYRHLFSPPSQPCPFRQSMRKPQTS